MAHPLLERWRTENLIIEVCPELAAGMATPRSAAEIEPGHNGDDVLDGHSRIVDRTDRNVTDFYRAGARAVLETAQANGCRFALLTDGSPSCGSGAIYDGTFSGTRHDGAGVTAALLRRHGIVVFAENQIPLLAAAMAATERD